ncbi:hypothetical protein GCM10010404_21610 [Nonomuraea africana]
MEVAVPLCSGPSVGTGQLARIQTVELSPAVTLSGLSLTSTFCLVVVAVAVAVAVAVPVAVLVAVVVAVPVGVPVCACAEHPATPNKRKAPAYATRLTVSTAAPHFAVFPQHPPELDAAPHLIPRKSG